MLLLLLLTPFAFARLEWKCPHPWLPLVRGNRAVCHRVFTNGTENILSYEEAEGLCGENNATLSVFEKDDFNFATYLVTRGWRISSTSDFFENWFWISKLSYSSTAGQNDTRDDCLWFHPFMKTTPCQFDAPENFTESLPVHVICESDIATKVEVAHFCELGWSLYEPDKTCHKLLNIDVSSNVGAEALCDNEDAVLSNLETFEKKRFAFDLIKSGQALNYFNETIPKFRTWIDFKRQKGNFAFKRNNAITDLSMYEIDDPRKFSGVVMCFTLDAKTENSTVWIATSRGAPCDSLKYDGIIKNVLCEKLALNENERQPSNERNLTAYFRICENQENLYVDGNKCHKLIPIAVSTFEGARTICQANGGRLSSIRSKQEMEFVMKLMQHGRMIRRDEADYFTHVWVDLSKNQTTGQWEWHGEEELSLEFLKHLIQDGPKSFCAAFSPLNYLHNGSSFFRMLHCDIYDYKVKGDVYPPSHILCEEEYDGESLTSTPTNLCPQDWSYFKQEKTCLKIFTKEGGSTQADAKKSCSALNANLVSIETQEKQDFLNDLAAKGWRARLVKEAMWIGLEKPGNTWKWANGMTFTDSLWDIPLLTPEKSLTSKCATFTPNIAKVYVKSLRFGNVQLNDCDKDARSRVVENFICERDSFESRGSPFDFFSSVTFFLIISLILTIALLFCGYKWRRLHSKYQDQAKLLTKNYLDFNVHGMDFDMTYHIPHENLVEEDLIGHGFFGTVRSAKLKHPVRDDKHMMVAVKSVNPDAPYNHRLSLDTEIKLMCQLESHENIVKIIGASHSDQRIGNRLVIEYCNGGNLKEFLNSARPVECLTGNAAPVRKLDVDDLISFAFQIARGMEFLSSLPCLHRDLAARNVLVKDNKICRITDFGLSNFANYYCVNGNTQLPVRWMSPETILTQTFTKESDVWSFGIVLFEIFSYGNVPYKGCDNSDVSRAILQGDVNKFNELPANCPEEIRNLTLKCWEMHPIRRPNFKQCYDVITSCFKQQFSRKYVKLLNLLKKEKILLESYKEWLPSHYQEVSKRPLETAPIRATNEYQITPLAGSYSTLMQDCPHPYYNDAAARQHLMSSTQED